MEDCDTMQKAVCRVYLIGDSLLLPRASYQGSAAVEYESTYPFLLSHALVRHQQKFGKRFELISNGLRARTLTDAAGLLPEIQLYHPQQLIVHLGIVDCAPRVFSRFQQSVVERLRPAFLRHALLGFVHRNRRAVIATLPKKSYTTLADYRKAAWTIAERCRAWGCRLAFVSIAPPTEEFKKRSPGIATNVDDYNSSVRAVCAEWGADYIDVHTLFHSPDPSHYLLSDGHHLGEQGHKIVAENLLRWITTSTAANQPGSLSSSLESAI